MLAQSEAVSNATIGVVSVGSSRPKVSRSSILRTINLTLIALALSGCAVPLRESDRLSEFVGRWRWIGEFPVVTGSIEANDRRTADTLLCFFGRLICNDR